MRKYVCKTCGYVYDPAVGDPDSGIEPGTPFETLPDDWSCPKCGSKKADFEPEDDPMPGIVAVPAGEENG